MTSRTPGAPRSIGDHDVERVIVKTLKDTPVASTHWSTSQSAVTWRWRGFDVNPPLSETFKLSPETFFIEEVRDIVGLYLNPPDAAVVLCVDEKSQIQALDRTSPVLPLAPGIPERRTHDYVLHGITSLYGALDVASIKVVTNMTGRHRAEEFQQFLTLINREVPRPARGGNPITRPVLGRLPSTIHLAQERRRDPRDTRQLLERISDSAH